jgi:hypothetical protein
MDVAAAAAAAAAATCVRRKKREETVGKDVSTRTETDTRMSITARPTSNPWHAQQPKKKERSPPRSVALPLPVPFLAPPFISVSSAIGASNGISTKPNGSRVLALLLLLTAALPFAAAVRAPAPAERTSGAAES